MGSKNTKAALSDMLWEETPRLRPRPGTAFRATYGWCCDLEGVFYRTVPTDDPTWSGDDSAMAIEVVRGNDFENIVTVPSKMYVHNPSHSDLVFTLDDAGHIVVQRKGGKGRVTIQYDVYKSFFVVYVLDVTMFIVINGYWLSTVRVSDVREMIEKDSGEPFRVAKGTSYGLKIGGKGANACAVLTNKYGTWISAPDTDLKLDPSTVRYCIFDSGVVVTVGRFKFIKWFRGAGKVAKDQPQGGWCCIQSDFTLPMDVEVLDMLALPRDLVGVWTLGGRLWIVTLEQDVVSIVDLRCGPGKTFVKRLFHVGHGQVLVWTDPKYSVMTVYRTEDGRQCVFSNYFEMLGGNAKSVSDAGMDGVDLLTSKQTLYAAGVIDLFRPAAYWLLLMYYKQQDSPFYKTRFASLLKREVCRWLFEK